MFIKIVIMIYRCPATSTTPDIKKLSVHIAFGRSGEKVTRLLIVKKSKKKKKEREKGVSPTFYSATKCTCWRFLDCD